ncbi:hypothetical protein LguiB_005687 [Lonicera macranthoides]
MSQFLKRPDSLAQLHKSNSMSSSSSFSSSRFDSKEFIDKISSFHEISYLPQD